MKYVLILILLAQCHQGQSQLPDYYVYLVTGDVTLSNNGIKPMTVKQKQLVYKNNTIVLKKGAEVTLVDKDGNFLVLNTAGTYKTGELIKKATKKNNEGITAKFLKLTFHELLDPHHDFEKFKKENIAGSGGGVSRGDDCDNRIFPVNGLKTSATSIVFKWYKTSPSSNYSFFIYDGEGKQLVKMSVKDTLQPVNINETLQGKTGKYFWLVTSEDGDCEDEVPIYFDLLTRERESEMTERLTGGIDSESLEMQLQQIDKLEKNAFIDAASVRYAALVKANPDNQALAKSYVGFLLKYGFEEEARAAWE